MSHQMPTQCILDFRGLASVFSSRWALQSAATDTYLLVETDCAQVAISDQNQMAALLLGLETALYLSSRLQVYMEFLTSLPISPARVNFETCLAEFHTFILRFLANAIRTYERRSVLRGLEAFWRIEEVSSFENKCLKMDNRAELEASNCDRDLTAISRAAVQQQGQDLRQVLKQLEDIRTSQSGI